MEKEFIFKNRSISSCLLAAYKLLGENMKGILQSTWLPVLLCGIFCGVFITTNIRLPEVQAFGTDHPALFLTIYTVSLIGMTVCSLWASSRLLSMLNGQTRSKNLLRMFLLYLCNLVIVVIIGGVLVVGALLCARHLKVNLMQFAADNWLVLAGVLLVAFIVMLPLVYVNMRYLFSSEASYFIDFPKAYGTGFRHIGFIFLTTLLGGIIGCIIGGIICLPFTILMVSQTFSAIGMLNGDPSGMPDYFATLHGATFGLTTMLLMYLSMYLMLVYMFLYGSIEQQREERRQSALRSTTDETSDPQTPTNIPSHDTAFNHPIR